MLPGSPLHQADLCTQENRHDSLRLHLCFAVTDRLNGVCWVGDGVKTSGIVATVSADDRSGVPKEPRGALLSRGFRGVRDFTCC